MSKRRKVQAAAQTQQDQQQREQPQVQERSRIEFITQTQPSWAIPVLPRFQADLPDWTDNRKEPDSEKWLGQQIWPFHQESNETGSGSTRDNDEEVIGKGRPEICSCRSPGSVECVNRHVAEERNRLKSELGPAFESWKFDAMGDEVSHAWTSREQKRFESLAKRNASSQDMRLLESAWKSFRGKDRKSLVSYYFNVDVPRRICKQTRSGCTEVGTDEDEVIESEKLQSNDSPDARKSRKSAKDSAKDNKYLSGRR